MANPENKQIPYESTQKDIRDAIESVATAIGGIAIPSADHVSYDNSGSGLSATDVQDAIDELSSEKADSSSLATVATSGDYDDLINKPTIPTVNDATLTIQKNGTTVATFSANASSNASANITVPTTTSELTNNSDFVSDASYVHTDNNFTTAEKTKLSGIESGAEVNVQSDWNQTDNTADDFIKNKPSSEVKSATDTFTTVNGGLLEECIIDLEPVQSGSGDPSPDNIRPISGHTEVKLQRDGKNLLPAEKYQRTAQAVGFGGNVETYYTLDAGTYTLSTYSTKAVGLFYRKYGSGTNTTILITGGNAGLRYGSFTLTERTSLTLWAYISDGLLPTDISWFMLEKGSVATPYEPYLGHLYAVQIGQTVYGGTVDLVSGVMTCDIVTDTYIWGDGTNESDRGNNISSKKFALSQSALNKEQSNKGDFTNLTNIQKYDISGTVHFYISPSNDILLFLPNDTDNSQSVQICYELATPIEITLTPQQIESLVGINNLSTPLYGQSIDSVKYREVFVFDDVEKVVNLRVPISMLGTDESGRTTASQAYASGDYFYKDGYMCKALTSISAGATLTLNTNYSQGTLADVLKAIENA